MEYFYIAEFTFSLKLGIWILISSLLSSDYSTGPFITKEE